MISEQFKHLPYFEHITVLSVELKCHIDTDSIQETYKWMIEQPIPYFDIERGENTYHMSAITYSAQHIEPGNSFYESSMPWNPKKRYVVSIPNNNTETRTSKKIYKFTVFCKDPKKKYDCTVYNDSIRTRISKKTSPDELVNMLKDIGFLRDEEYTIDIAVLNYSLDKKTSKLLVDRYSLEKMKTFTLHYADGRINITYVGYDRVLVQTANPQSIKRIM